MVEIDKAAEFRRLKKQHDGEEDPVIIAQRFLNIFRQLHIFSAEKKEAFNQMLLELPPYIRGLFGSLPGGGILQEYVDDLAEKQGIEVGSHTSAAAATPAGMEEEVAKARILATALAEAQAQAAPINPTIVNPDGTTATVIQAAPSKIELGSNFAQELGKILAAALKENNQAAKEEIRSMVSALGETQLEVVKVLHNDNAERRQDSERLAVMLTQAQGQIAEMLTHPEEFGAGSETSKLIKMLADSQAQIAETLETIKENGGNNTDSAKLFELSQQQFIKAVDAINENGRQNSKAIAEAISESQQELAKLIIQQNNQRMAASAQVEGENLKINAADYLSQLNMIADKFSSAQGNNGKNIEKTVESLVKAQLDVYREVASRQAQELSSVISAALKESQEISNKNLIKALENLPKTTIIEKTVPQPILTTPFFTPAAGTASQDSSSFSKTTAAASDEPTAGTAPLFHSETARADATAENPEDSVSAAEETSAPEEAATAEATEAEPLFQNTVSDDETNTESAAAETFEPTEENTVFEETTPVLENEVVDETAEADFFAAEEETYPSGFETPDMADSELPDISGESAALPGEPAAEETTQPKKSKKRKSKNKTAENFAGEEDFSGEAFTESEAGEGFEPYTAEEDSEESTKSYEDYPAVSENLPDYAEQSDNSLDDLFNIGEEPDLTSEEINKPKKKKKKKKNKNKNREQAVDQDIGDIFPETGESSGVLSFDELPGDEQFPASEEQPGDENLSLGEEPGSDDFDLHLEDGYNLSYGADADFTDNETQDDNPETDAGNNADAMPVEFDWDDDKPATEPQDDYKPLSKDILEDINQSGTFDLPAEESQDNQNFDYLPEETAAPQDGGDFATNGWGESESDTVYNNSVQPDQTLPEDGEWEWEYEEVPEDETDGGQSEDWEWEYEEVPEDDTTSGEETAADDQGWEYVEVPENETMSEDEGLGGSEEAAESATGGDQEWEWDYEEVPEDEAEDEFDASYQNDNPPGGKPASNW